MRLDSPTHWVIQRRISHKHPTLGHIVFAGTKVQCEEYKKMNIYPGYDQFIIEIGDWDEKE